MNLALWLFPLYRYDGWRFVDNDITLGIISLNISMIPSIHLIFIIWKPVISIRADVRLAPSQWETSLQSNAVSHWLGASPEYRPYKFIDRKLYGTYQYAQFLGRFEWTTPHVSMFAVLFVQQNDWRGCCCHQFIHPEHLVSCFMSPGLRTDWYHACNLHNIYFYCAPVGYTRTHYSIP